MNQNTKEFQREMFEIQVTELVSILMKRKKISKLKLARLLGKDIQYVTAFLQDATQFTLSEISDIFYVLEEKPIIGI